MSHTNSESVVYSIRKICKKNILVIGEIMLDEYYWGSVDRISPEAPVPVFLKKRNTYRLGGAANVAMNMAVNGMDVSVLSIIGHDNNGRILRSVFRKEGISDNYLLETDRPTCTKLRLFASNNQQVIRIDEEDSNEIDSKIEKELIELLAEALNNTDVIVISDYMKGLLTKTFVQSIIETARESGVKVLIDAKDPDTFKYKGACLIKPNRKELALLSKKPVSTIDEVKEAMQQLLKICDSEYVLTTLGSEGMILTDIKGQYIKLEATPHEVYDVTGAGDTVIAYIAMGIASELSIENAMVVANHAAGIQISKVGTSSVKLNEIEKDIKLSGREVIQNKVLDRDDLFLIREMNRESKIVFTNGCFDILHIGHVRYLREAASLGDMLIVGVNSDMSVKKIKGDGRPVNKQEDRIEMLASYDFIDKVVLFDEETPYEIIKVLQPDVLVKGGDYEPADVVGKDIVENNNGEVVIIPLVEGKSTTSIIEEIKDIGK